MLVAVLVLRAPVISTETIRVQNATHTTSAAPQLNEWMGGQVTTFVHGVAPAQNQSHWVACNQHGNAPKYAGYCSPEVWFCENDYRTVWRESWGHKTLSLSITIPLVWSIPMRCSVIAGQTLVYIAISIYFSIGIGCPSFGFWILRSGSRRLTNSTTVIDEYLPALCVLPMSTSTAVCAPAARSLLPFTLPNTEFLLPFFSHVRYVHVSLSVCSP